MKKPAVFKLHFQNPVQIVHVYEVLRSGSFFQKFHGRFNLMSIFFTFHRFYEKTYEKTYQFYGLFPNVLSLCARSRNFVISKFFWKEWRGCFNILTIYDSFAQFAATFVTKLMKISAIFFTYFETSTLFLQVYKVSSLANQ